MESIPEYRIPRRRLLCACAGGISLAACGGNPDSSSSSTPPVAGPDSLKARGCLSISASAARATLTPQCGNSTPTTGDPARDNAFRSEFNAQAVFWGVPGVSFNFLNDCDVPNALANPQDKSILFGTAMARDLLAKFRSSIPLIQVLAHEWGHQIQFAFGDSWLNAATVAPKELEADMFSGFYLLLTKSNFPISEMNSSISAAFSLGDWDFNNPNHHGTPQQRGAAILAGNKVALEYQTNAIPRTYPAVRQRFFQELAFIV